MSLYHLGIVHFRHFTSPTQSSFESNSSQDLTQDNQDVLVERLNDLVLRLSKNTSSSLDDSTVTAVHSQVDCIELLIRGAERVQESDHVDKDAPLSPPRQVRMRMADNSASQARSPLYSKTVTTSQTVALTKAADQLASRLAATVNELQTRREESDHIHDLLLTRAEMAAERILLLEQSIADMENDFDSSELVQKPARLVRLAVRLETALKLPALAKILPSYSANLLIDQSELKFLRIQLQGIEAQCSLHIPHDQDEELSKSIKNWKVDWEDISRRSKARRKISRLSITTQDDSHVS